MKSPRERVCRPVIRSLLRFAPIFLPKLILPSALAGQSQNQLQLTAHVSEQRYCSVNPNPTTLQLKLRVRFTNLGADRLIIYQGHDLFYQNKVRSGAATETQPYGRHWQRKGFLWSQPLTSIPISLVIEKPGAAPPCC